LKKYVIKKGVIDALVRLSIPCDNFGGFPYAISRKDELGVVSTVLCVVALAVVAGSSNTQRLHRALLRTASIRSKAIRSSLDIPRQPQAGYRRSADGIPRKTAAPAMTAAPAAGGAMATPGPLALPCTSDANCGTAKCNVSSRSAHSPAQARQLTAPQALAATRPQASASPVSLN